MQHIKKKWADVVVIINGKNQKNVVNSNGKYPIYGSGGIIGYADDFLCEAGTTIVGRKGTINAPIYVDERFWNVDTAFGIYPKKEVLPKYLFFFCQAFNFKTLDKSTTIPSLAKRDLLNIEMPVPSLSEQKRIITYFEERFSLLESGIEALQKAKQQLVVYRQAVLQKEFTEYKSWKKYQLSDLIEEMRNGYGKKPSDSGNYNILKISAVRAMNINFDEKRKNDIPFNEDDLIKENDILFTRYNGSKDYVGVCASVPGLKEEFAYPDKLIRCRPKINSTVHSKFLQYWLNQGEARKYIRSKIKTTSGQNGISGGDLKKTPVFLPSFELQEQIVINIEEKMFVCKQMEKTIDLSLFQTESMRQSILKNTFEGGFNHG